MENKISSESMSQMTYKRVYFSIFIVCIIAAFGLGFGNGDTLIYLGSIVGVLSGSFVLFNRISKLSPSSGTLLFYRTLCDVGIGIRLLLHDIEKLYVCGGINCHMEADYNHTKEDRCAIPAAIFEFFQIASEMWLLCVALDLAVTMSNPFSSFKHRLKKYHLLVWGTALFFALLLGLRNRQYGIWGVDSSLESSICWYDSDPDQSNYKKVNGTKVHLDDEEMEDSGGGGVISNVINARPFLYFYVPVITFYSYIVYVMICAQRILSRGIHTTFLHRIHTLEISRFILSVFLGYWISQACLYFTADLIYSVHENSANYIYQFLLFGMSAKAFPCLLVYLILMKSENRLLQHAEKQDRRKTGTSIELNIQESSITNPLKTNDLETVITNAAEEDIENPLFDVNTTLQHQVFVYITLGMKILAKRHTPESRELVTIRFRVPSNFIVPRDDIKAITEGNLQKFGQSDHDQVFSNIIEANSEFSTFLDQSQIPPASVLPLPPPPAPLPPPPIISTPPSTPPSRQSVLSQNDDRPSAHFDIEELENQKENARISITSPHRSRKFSFHNSVMLMSGEQSDVTICDVIGSSIYQYLRLSSIILELNDSVEFTEYMPSTFQAIRLKFHVLEDYAVAFEKDIKSKVTEGGASNALFFYSQCNRFIAKSCTTAEMLHIRKVAPLLLNYFTSQPNTLITKIFGAYKLKMYACDLYFIVTNNVKYTWPGETISDVYDLKGSSINRFMKLPKDGDKPVCKYCGNKFVYNSKSHIRKKKELTRVFSLSADEVPRLSGDSISQMYRDSGLKRKDCPMFRHEPEAVLKDNDLRTRARFRFSPQEASTIKRQLYYDTKFLKDLGVMDYSLLVAVYKKVTQLAVPENSKENENNFQSQSSNGRRTTMTITPPSSLLSSTPPPSSLSTPISMTSRRVQAVEIHAEYAYYIGIIDYQQEYNIRKQIENFVKINISREPPDELSCVSPDLYGKRFFKFMCDLVSGDEEEMMRNL